MLLNIHPQLVAYLTTYGPRVELAEGMVATPTHEGVSIIILGAKSGPKPPAEHNKVESKKVQKIGRFPKLRAAGSAAGGAKKAFSKPGLPPWKIGAVAPLGWCRVWEPPGMSFERRGATGGRSAK